MPPARRARRGALRASFTVGAVPPQDDPPAIDLNADLGEAYGSWRAADDAAMLQQVSSANLACGFHAGDPRTLAATARQAVRNGVRIGAHPGYADLRGFGRRRLPIPSEELHADIVYQIGGLRALVHAAGGDLAYVKPHGALYHAVGDDADVAATVFDAVAVALPGTAVLLAAGSPATSAAEAAGLETVPEAFVDRAYAADGTLLPRGDPGAVLDDPDACARQAVRLAVEGRLVARGGGEVELRAASLCLHGDTPGAVRTARAVRRALVAAGVAIRPFAPDPLGEPPVDPPAEPNRR